MTVGSKPPFFVAVAGGSGSGKTTMVAKLVERLADFAPLVLSLDHYYRDLSGLSEAERAQVNFDHPDAIERDLLLAQVTMLSEGRAIDRPTYDFTTHTRSRTVVHLEPRPVIVLDGIFSLYDPRLNSLVNLKVFLDVDADLRLARRIRRDLAQRGRSFEGTVDQYFSTVKEMHGLFIEPTKHRADFVVPWEVMNLSAVQMLADLIRHRVS